MYVVYQLRSFAAREYRLELEKLPDLVDQDQGSLEEQVELK